ncbi:MAG TPA: DUF4375 domain-containing protein [Puia sp.]|uniref:DMP19 family protein n=1 Tax=Puia sp. TaxID=2045100 RepID=UPI002C915926|nr:DUF4375 domain-containing protein [Puia sp.]HVU99258.1 DUF4375 domain-containing protein [Puia sp.]
MKHVIVKAKVNSETIKGLDDEQLEALVYEKACQLDSGTFGERFTRSEGHVLLCEIFATAVLDGEVHNGGFDQFFYQDSRLLPFAVEGLKKIGAGAHAELLARAANIYAENEGRKEPANDTDEGDSGRIHELDPLDDEYYALEETFPLRVRFVRANIEKFFD